jgi:glycosyltransferase 2 family protein
MSEPVVTGRPVAPGRDRRILPPTRYRHPGDVIRLILAGSVLVVAGAITYFTHATYAGASATAVPALRLSADPGRALDALVAAAFVVAAVAGIAVTLRHRRFRLLASLAGGAAAAIAVLIVITHFAGGEQPRALAASASGWPWILGPSAASPALGAAAAGVVIGAPWLRRAWRRTAWIALWLAAAGQLITGLSSPMQVVLALAAGTTVGAAVLVVFGEPDRRIGPDAIAAALGAAGVPVSHVEPADVETKGSRPFVAAAADGTQLFVKVLGADNRDADLLYRSYRLLRLRDIGDTRPAASLIQAVEHQALAAVMAERAGVAVPAVRQVVQTPDGSALLVMDRVDGCSLDRVPPHLLTDALLRALWQEVDRLHRAKIAHRSLQAGNIVVDRAGRPWLTDFSFSELAATERQMALDVAELLASLATIAGADRAVASAATAIAPDDIAAAVPLLQPLALSSGTRHAVARQDGLLTQTRDAAVAASGRDQPPELARVERVRPKTLLAIAAAAGAFYFVLPELLKAQSSWHSVLSANWAWLPLIIAFSVATYLASAVALIGAVPRRVPFWPTLVAQLGSSFVNRVSPGNVGGMALNVRFLQKCGVDANSGAAAVGVNSLVGAVVHLIMIVIFFSWAHRALNGLFKLPSSTTLLVVLSIILAVVGLLLATRPGRRFASGKLLPALRSAAVSLWQVAKSPSKMIMLVGGSALITLFYIAGLVASVAAFGGGLGIAVIGAVYLGAAAVAAAAPTPGGLGPFEVTAIAGLSGAGMSAGTAFAAVILYRLSTYWLPVLPGWLGFRLLQRWDYV